jgi:hypothetical protein
MCKNYQVPFCNLPKALISDLLQGNICEAKKVTETQKSCIYFLRLKKIMRGPQEGIDQKNAGLKGLKIGRFG